MLNETTLEKRVAILEQTVLDLQRKLEDRSDSTNSDNWLEALAGSISNEEVFLEALEYGRAYRQSDRPGDEADETS